MNVDVAGDGGVHDTTSEDVREAAVVASTSDWELRTVTETANRGGQIVLFRGRCRPSARSARVPQARYAHTQAHLLL